MVVASLCHSGQNSSSTCCFSIFYFFSTSVGQKLVQTSATSSEFDAQRVGWSLALCMLALHYSSSDVNIDMLQALLIASYTHPHKIISVLYVIYQHILLGTLTSVLSSCQTSDVASILHPLPLLGNFVCYHIFVRDIMYKIKEVKYFLWVECLVGKFGTSSISTKFMHKFCMRKF